MEPVSNTETEAMNNFARAYEIGRIERVLDSLDNKVFKDLSAYADAEHFLRFARDEIRRLQAENQSIQQERDKLVERVKKLLDNPMAAGAYKAGVLDVLREIGVEEHGS